MSFLTNPSPTSDFCPHPAFSITEPPKINVQELVAKHGLVLPEGSPFHANYPEDLDSQLLDIVIEKEFLECGRFAADPSDSSASSSLNQAMHSLSIKKACSFFDPQRVTNRVEISLHPKKNTGKVAVETFSTRMATSTRIREMLDLWHSQLGQLPTIFSRSSLTFCQKTLSLSTACSFVCS